MSNKVNKPKQSAKKLVEKLRDEKGVKFKYTNEIDAEDYFLYQNNYMRTAAFRKNYEKYQTGIHKGKYINLDFAYLTELATIDMHLRFLLLRMCIDIEHALKVQLVREIETNFLEDGYTIVNEVYTKFKSFKNNTLIKSDSPNCKDLIASSFKFATTYNQYRNGYVKMSSEISDIDCSVWTFLEICSFGDLMKFYRHYYTKYCLLPSIEDGILNSVKSIRNTCAHNNCLFFNLKNKDTTPAKTIINYVAKVPSVGKSLRDNQLSIRPIYEFTCLLYVYCEVVSKKVHFRCFT